MIYNLLEKLINSLLQEETVKLRSRMMVSELSKAFNISKRTPIYYDEIWIFKPNYKDNSYRYYSEPQIHELKFILTLKKSGFILKEIKEYTTIRDNEESKRKKQKRS